MNAVLLIELAESKARIAAQNIQYQSGIDIVRENLELCRIQLDKAETERDALRAQLAAVQMAECEWREDHSGIWYCCDSAWELYEGTPKESGYKYCPCCGKLIVAMRYVEPEQEQDEDEVQP